MEKSQIKQVYSELKNEVKINPESLKVHQKLELLRKLVHEEIIKNIKGVFSDYREKSTTYEGFINNSNERSQMEKTVLKKELGLDLSIDDIEKQISLAIYTTMDANPNIFGIKVGNEKKGNSGKKGKIEKSEPIKQENNEENLDEKKELTDGYLEKNKEKIIRLVRDKKTKWFSMNKKTDTSTFFIELDGYTVPYYRIEKLFLGSNTRHESMLRVHVKLSEAIFDEETMNSWYESIKQAILQKRDWEDLESLQDLKNNYSVEVNGVVYKYVSLISIFGINLKNNKILSREVFRELSRTMFGKNWRKALKIESSKRYGDGDEYPYWMEEEIKASKNSKLSKKGKDVNKKQEIGVKTEKPETIEDVPEDDEEGVVEKREQKKSEIEILREKRLLSIRELAEQELSNRPELKDLWFGEDEKVGAAAFVLNYQGNELKVRKICELIGLYGKDKVIDFNEFIIHIFGKEYVDAMRDEVKKKKVSEVSQESNIEEKVTNNGEFDKDPDEEKTEIVSEVIVENVVILEEDETSIEGENVKEESAEENNEQELNKIEDEGDKTEKVELTEKFFLLLKDRVNIEEIDSENFNDEVILTVFDEIVEQGILEKKDNINKRLTSLTTEDWSDVISQCKKSYPNADNASLRESCKKASFTDEIKTEYLLHKQTEVREKVCDYLDGGDMKSFSSFCGDVIKEFENSDFGQECYDYYIDSIENEYRRSHMQNEKGILNEIKNEENEIREKEEQEKEYNYMMDFCEKNEITVEKYKILYELSHTLKRKVGSKPGKLMRYLLKLSKRKSALRAEEFENDMDIPIINKLASLGITVIFKGKTQ